MSRPTVLKISKAGSVTRVLTGANPTERLGALGAEGTRTEPMTTGHAGEGANPTEGRRSWRFRNTGAV